MSWWDFVAKLDGRRQLRRWMFTVCGTGVPWWVGPDADVARAVARYFHWQPVGYPAATFPMGKSVDAGVVEFLRLLDEEKPPDMEWDAIGYSQGALVLVKVYKHLVATKSRHLATLKRVGTFGNPGREWGVTNGNKAFGWEIPKGRGIAPASERMVDTPEWWYDFAHVGDIYTDTPEGPLGSLEHDIGEDMTMVYRMVQDPVKGFGLSSIDLGKPLTAVKQPGTTGGADISAVAGAVLQAQPRAGLNIGGLLGGLFSAIPGNPADAGQDTLIEQLGEMMTSPLAEFPAAIGAIINGLTFVANPKGPTYTHISYPVGDAVRLFTEHGEKVPVLSGG